MSKTSTQFVKYGFSKLGNFYVKDSMIVPHPFCITPTHVSYVSDHGGILDETNIKRSGGKCGVRGCNLSYSQHERTLLVACHVDFQKDDEAKKELQEYLIGIKEMAESENYAGFVFISEEERAI